jgi:hypothetical protein
MLQRLSSGLLCGGLPRGPLAALILIVSAVGGLACPLCYEAARQLMTDGVRLDSADRAVLAARDAADAPLRVVAVVKGSDEVGDIVFEPVTEADGVAAASGETSLLVRDPSGPQWTNLGAIPLAEADWLRRIVATREISGDRPRRTWPLTVSTADALSYAGWRERVALVLPYLENANSLAARLAWGELARAPYAALNVTRSRIGAATVEAWLDDPRLAPRRATYLTLLGFVGGPEDGSRLDQRIETALASHDAKDLGAMIAADLEISGPSHVGWVEMRIFADRKRTMPEIEAALLALNVLGDANGAAVPRARVIAAYRTFIKERPLMAGFVAPQLADWGCWDAASDYAALVKSTPNMGSGVAIRHRQLSQARGRGRCCGAVESWSWCC